MTSFIEGMDEFQRKIERMGENAERLDGSIVPITDLLSDEFMREHTRFTSIQEFFEASGITPSQELVNDSSPGLDRFIADETPWKSWGEMRTRGLEDYAARRLLEE